MARPLQVFLVLVAFSMSFLHPFARSSPLKVSKRLDPRLLNLSSGDSLLNLRSGDSLLTRRSGDSLLRTLIIQRIMILRVISIAKENGYIVGATISKESVLGAAPRLAEHPGVSKVLSSIKEPPSRPEVLKVLQWMKRDYFKYRKMTSQLSDSEALLVRAVETSHLFPTTLTTPSPSPSPDPRWFLFVPSAPPEVNEEGLDGIASMAEDVANAAEEEDFFAKLQNNMFINSIITTYAFVVVEFLTEIGLGDVVTVGTLVADTWLLLELSIDIRDWAEHHCYLPKAWPFHYFYPEHCRLLFEQLKKQEQEKAKKASGDSKGSDADDGDESDAGKDNGAGDNGDGGDGNGGGDGGNGDGGDGGNGGNGDGGNGDGGNGDGGNGDDANVGNE